MRQAIDHGIEDRNAGNPQSRAMLFELMAEIGVDNCEEYDAGLALDIAKHALKLLWCADKGIDMLDRPVIGVMRSGRAGYSVQSFAGCIGDEMHVEKSRFCLC